jgi:glyoxylate/hydroxypyruvate reductase A
VEIDVRIVLPPAQRQRLADGAPGMTIRYPAEGAASDAPIIFGNPDPAIVAGNPNLRWMQLESTGFGEYADLDWRRAHAAVQVTNLAGFFADPVAETALAGILALLRGIDRLCTLRAAADWIGDDIRPTLGSLSGAPVVLFGRGSINSRLGQLLAPFDCPIESFGRDWSAAQLDQALARARVVVATVPHSPGTEGLFDAARIARMRPDTIFCNLGRGTLVDEAALARALQSGQLGGAVIDVTRTEPLGRDHPFWTTPNTILTQHSGGGTSDEVNRKIDWFLANLQRFRAGDPLKATIDLVKGY